MTDWSKLKVADLKDELKARGIPLTGLKLKQQFIEKLEGLGQGFHGAVETTGHEEVSETTTQETTAPLSQTTTELGTKNDAPKAQLSPIAGEERADVPASGMLPSATSASAEHPELMDSYSSAPKPSPSQSLSNTLKHHQKPYVIEPSTQERRKIDVNDSSAQPSETSQPSITSAPSTTSTPIPAGELIEDSKKRKRRSVTPPPSAGDVALKKSKARDGTPIIRKQESSALEQVQEATDAAEALRHPERLGSDTILNDTNAEARDFTVTVNTVDSMASLSANEPADEEGISLRISSPEKNKSESPVPAEQNRAVTPALHPATRSLYMRNFKRPLHIPTLRNRIAEFAQPPTSTFSDEIIASFYLDPIRTHAFISFTSVSAASRVRTSMHDTVFPDEATRVPIWIDFVPDNMLQSWIDKENANGSDKNRKWEVIYNIRHDGVEAIHKEVGAALPSRKENAPQRQSATSETRSRTTPSAQGIHPERAAMIPREERSSNYRPSSSRMDHRSTATSNPHIGRGFKALDELFSSTIAKPKLYYKTVPANVAESRLDMIRGLRVGHSEMGRSGNPGMMRYSFEGYKNQEEWVEKGPEFGYGRKGVERLAGRGGRGSTGFRGGRRFDGGRGGESWRG